MFLGLNNPTMQCGSVGVNDDGDGNVGGNNDDADGDGDANIVIIC